MTPNNPEPAAQKFDLKHSLIDAEITELKAKVAANDTEIARLNASLNHHRDLGITLLDAKYLDPNCWKGCKSLVWQDRLKKAEAELANEKAGRDSACRTVAAMYEAATGTKGEGPKRGVVEDLADLRSELMQTTQQNILLKSALRRLWYMTGTIEMEAIVEPLLRDPTRNAQSKGDEALDCAAEEKS